MPDTAGNSSTTSSLTIDGAAIADTLDVAGDHDWFRVNLVAGQTYVFTTSSATGANDTTLDTTLTLRDSSGTQIKYNDDYANPPGYFSKITFTATYTGTYYLDVGGYGEAEAGSYQIAAATGVAITLPVYTNDQIAYQLTNGYWGGSSHHFNVTPGGTLKVDVTALSATEQALAVAALDLWSDATGITFQQVAPGQGAKITFTNNQAGAFSSASYANSITSSATVNISSSWLTSSGSTIDSYTFQAYVHEIGHALGLGHGGNYDGTAAYPDDALYANDAWVTTIMSYFDPYIDNTYFSDQGFTYQYTVTPMAADVIAVNNLYGARPATTRTGNTTYGFNDTSGRAVFNASLYPGLAVTIVDDGGTDTLDYSGFSQAQRLDLNPETFSSTGGQTGNLVIARGTVIENAIGGSGNDVIIGNSVANTLTGGLGSDSLDGGAGNDILKLNASGSDTALGGDGDDVLFYGAQFGTGDRADGGAGTDQLVLHGAYNTTFAADALTAIEAIKLYRGSATPLGDAAAGLVDYRLTMNDANLAPGATMNIKGQNLGAGEHLYFNGSAETSGTYKVRGGPDIDTIIGGAGNDVLAGKGGADVLTGGAGNDTFLYLDVTDSTNAARDTITDFASGDRINLATIDAITGGTDDPFTYVGSAFTGHAGELILVSAGGSNWLLEGDTNGDGTPDIVIAITGAGGYVPVAGNIVL